MGHQGEVHAVAAVNSGTLISAGDDCTLKVWDAASGICCHTMRGHTAAVVAVAVLSRRRAVSASDDRTLRVWDLERGTCVRRLEGHEGEVWTVAALGSMMAISGGADDHLKVWALPREWLEGKGLRRGYAVAVDQTVAAEQRSGGSWPWRLQICSAGVGAGGQGITAKSLYGNTLPSMETTEYQWVPARHETG